jgi:hypothetical protein
VVVVPHSFIAVRLQLLSNVMQDCVLTGRLRMLPGFLSRIMRQLGRSTKQ